MLLLLCLEVRPLEISSFHISLSIDLVISQVLFMQPILKSQPHSRRLGFQALTFFPPFFHDVHRTIEAGIVLQIYLLELGSPQSVVLCIVSSLGSLCGSICYKETLI